MGDEAKKYLYEKKIPQLFEVRNIACRVECRFREFSSWIIHTNVLSMILMQGYVKNTLFCRV